MGYAVDNLASQTTSTRKQRPSKPGTNVAHYTGNLVAYRHDLTALNSLVASSAKPVPPAPVDLEPVSDTTTPKPETNSKTTIASAVAANSTYAARPGLLQTARSSLSQRAVPIAGCLCLVGVAGLTWYLLDSPTNTDIQQPSTLTSNTSDASLRTPDNAVIVPETTVAPAEAIVVESVTLEPPAALPNNTTIEAVPVQTPDFTAEYREEIDWLQGQNVDLRGQIVVLEQETLELHEEILHKELEQLAQEAEARETGRPNVEYKYVDVPVGTYVGNAPAEYAGSYGNNPTSLSASATSGPAALPSVPVAAEPSSPPPVLASVNNGVTFDPDTGFYIDPNYSSSDYADPDSLNQVNDVSARTEFPPIPSE